MIRAERFNLITNLSNEKDVITLEELAERLNVSVATVRRDVEELCGQARATGLPPELSAPARERLERLCRCKTALELMGIPALDKAGLRHMRQYWEAERARRQPDAPGRERL